MHSVQTLIPAAVTSLLRQGTMSQAKLEVAWRLAVGDALNRATTARLREAGVIEVEAADQRWHREVTRSRSVILARLRSLLGEQCVESLVFRGPVGPAFRRTSSSRLNHA
jgi:predicted nucleic acid-binding Zn ribbon protein